MPLASIVKVEKEVNEQKTLARSVPICKNVHDFLFWVDWPQWNRVDAFPGNLLLYLYFE